MLRNLVLASLALLCLGACASNGVRYVDPSGKEYTGAIHPVTNTITADIKGKAYRGPFQVNDWGQAKSTLTSAGADPLYCDFHFQALKVKGTCTDLSGGDYSLRSR